MFVSQHRNEDGPVAILQKSWVKVGSFHFQDVLSYLEHLVWQHQVGNVAKVLVEVSYLVRVAQGDSCQSFTKRRHHYRSFRAGRV